MAGKTIYRLDENLRKDWFLILILGILLVAALVVYARLPERVPLHWNIHGEIDGYGSRFTGAFALPFLTIGIYAGMLLLPLVDPRRANYARFSTAYRAVRAGMVIFMVLLYGITTAAALGSKINISKSVPIIIGLLFIFLGRYLPLVKPNYFIGIRTPWTLASKDVWRRTHRWSGQLFLAAGIVSILAAFFPAPVNFWLMIGALLGAALITVIYSAVIYFRQTNR